MRKKFKTLTVILCSAAVSLNMAAPYLNAKISQDQINYLGLPINDSTAKYFPDAKFQAYLARVVDKDQNGYLSDDEINNVTEIELTSADAGIASVEGIEVFTNLERFICQDLATETGSTNLTLKFSDPNQTTEKYNNVNAKLKYVSCNHSKITGLDLTGCSQLEYLNCSDNNDLATLDLSENPKLEYLYCSNTKLAQPDLSKNTELKVLDCSFKKDDNRASETGVFNGTSPALTTLDLSKNTKLEYLDCSGHTTLTGLTLASDFGDSSYLKGNALKYLDCHGCGLTSIDLTYGTLLQYLNCSENNSLSGLDVSKNTKLEELNCSDSSGFTTLALGKDSAIRTLDCSNTKVAELDLSNSTSLESLNCSGTELLKLDLSKNTALESLLCEERISSYNAVTSTFTYSDGPDSKITELKLNRLLHGKAGLFVNEIFDNMDKRSKVEIDYGTGENKVDSNIDIYYTDNALDTMKVLTKDITKPSVFKEKNTTERTVIYTNLNGETADLTAPEKQGDYTLARCTHLFKDVNRTSVINGEPIIVYANGASRKITKEDGTVVKQNSGALTVYTNIAASYKVNERGKASTGKVVVGITDSAEIPTVTSNKIDGASSLATAKIQNGMITIKTKKKTDSGTGNVCYLWIIDTGSNGTYECCPINILVAPNKLEVRNEKDNDPSLKDATRMIGEKLEVCVAGYADSSKTMRTKDATYIYSVPDAVKDCVDIEQKGADRFIITAKNVNNSKDTKVNIMFTCTQNNKKIKFVLKVSAAPLTSSSSSQTPTP